MKYFLTQSCHFYCLSFKKIFKKNLPLTYSSNSLKKISYQLRANWIGLWFYSLQKPGSVPKYGVICSALPSVLKQHHCPENSEDLMLLHRTTSSPNVFHFLRPVYAPIVARVHAKRYYGNIAYAHIASSKCNSLGNRSMSFYYFL